MLSFFFLFLLECYSHYLLTIPANATLIQGFISEKEHDKI